MIDFDVINNVIRRKNGFSPVQGEKSYTKLRFFFKSGYGWDNCTAVTASFAISADMPVYSEPSLIDKATSSAVFDIPSAFRTHRGKVYISVQGSYGTGTDVVTIASGIAEIDIKSGVMVKEGVEQGLYEKVAALVTQSSVTQYGAKGDGVTDDTEAIYKAIVRNDVVYFPPGVYRTAGIVIANPPEKPGGGDIPAGGYPKTLLGAGRSTVIKPLNVSNYGYFCTNCGHVHKGTLPDEDYVCPDCMRGRSFLVKISDANNAVIQIGRKISSNPDVFDTVSECTVSDISIEGNYGEGSTARFSRGICLYATKRSTIHNVWIRYTKGFGVDLARNSEDCHLSDVKVKYCVLHGISQGGFGNSLTNIDVSQCQKDGINISVGGCQFANVKTWGNYEAGLRISGAKYCMISNVNAQQNRGSGLVIESIVKNNELKEAAFNVVTGFEAVGNNYTLNESNNSWNPNLTFEGGSGIVVGGHDNTVQGSDIRAKWEGDWYAVEKSALYMSADAHDNRIDIVCADGTTALSSIYNNEKFANIGFDQSVMIVKHNNNNCVRVNGSLIDSLTISNGIYSRMEYRSYDLSTLGGFDEKATVNSSVIYDGNENPVGKQFIISGENTEENKKAVNDIAPRSVAGSCSLPDSGAITGSFVTRIEGQDVRVRYPALIYYEIPINQIAENKLLKINFTAQLTGDDKWIVMPILRLREWVVTQTNNNDSTETRRVVNSTLFINNKRTDTEPRGIINSNSEVTRQFYYLITADKLGDTNWTECHLVLALLKTENLKKTDSNGNVIVDEQGNPIDDNTTEHSVTLRISELSYAFDSVSFLAQNEFNTAHYTKSETDALIAAAIQTAIGGVENGSY
jgi:hypothetical protein